jgi:hypothetical protein
MREAVAWDGKRKLRHVRGAIAIMIGALTPYLITNKQPI